MYTTAFAHPMTSAYFETWRLYLLFLYLDWNVTEFRLECNRAVYYKMRSFHEVVVPSKAYVKVK
jgi:hypothetical protein